MCFKEREELLSKVSVEAVEEISRRRKSDANAVEYFLSHFKIGANKGQVKKHTPKPNINV